MSQAFNSPTWAVVSWLDNKSNPWKVDWLPGMNCIDEDMGGTGSENWGLGWCGCAGGGGTVCCAGCGV